ncbi:MAG: glycine/sarcosine/betaine reductase selenoprotein B family protein [Blastocatellia bacterium]
MATYDDLSFADRVFIKGYPFKRSRIDPVPCSPLLKRLSDARVALVTTGGLHTYSQPPFDASIKMGDCSFREIPNDIEVRDLLESHKSKGFDHSGVREDRNLVLPLDRFRGLESQGKIGELNRRHFSFMGSIISPQRLIDETGPQVARLLREDGVEAVFLTPL